MAGLLLLLAHPDDETFLAAGTIARYTSVGIPVGLVCATRGERGATAELCTVEELPAVREAELREAARILGIGEVDVLPYEDQKLWTAPVDEIRRYLVSAIRRQRPRIIITFDPHGGNQHTDHISISRFASDAVPAAADPRWYPEAGAPHSTERLLWQGAVAPFDFDKTHDLPAHPGVDFLLDVADFRERKEAAMRAHRTQFPGLQRLMRADAAMRWEAFRLASGPRPASVPSEDLFAA